MYITLRENLLFLRQGKNNGCMVTAKIEPATLRLQVLRATTMLGARPKTGNFQKLPNEPFSEALFRAMCFCRVSAYSFCDNFLQALHRLVFRT